MSSGLFNLNGKRALITGSSQGIGFALAKGLAAAGVEIVLNGRNAEKLASAAKALEADGTKTHQLAFDATDHTAVREAVDGFESASGAIDILVNNAGMQHRTALQAPAPSGTRTLAPALPPIASRAARTRSTPPSLASPASSPSARTSSRNRTRTARTRCTSAAPAFPGARSRTVARTSAL